MIAAYEGNLPYIFVSYAHKDSREVFDLIEKLSARGYRIWYDEGIEPGTEWPENIAEHLLRADMVLAMITNDSMESVNCRREINFALSKNKPFLSVILEKTDIPAGMELQLSSQQSVLRYNYNSEERFLDKIESCSFMDSCKSETGTNNPAGATVSNTTYAGTNRKQPGIFIAVGLGIVLAALILVLVLPKISGVNEPPKGTGTTINQHDSSVTDSSVHNTDSGIIDSSDGNNTSDISSSSVAIENSAITDSSTENGSEPGERWLYSVKEDDTSLIYTFSSGPVIVMPADWNNMISVEEKGDYFVFYHEHSKNAWKNDGYENAGKLFSLGYSATTDYKDFPSYSELGKGPDGYYFLMYPTDVQGYMNNERIYNEYIELADEIDYVRKNSTFSLE